MLEEQHTASCNREQRSIRAGGHGGDRPLSRNRLDDPPIGGAENERLPAGPRDEDPTPLTHVFRLL
jgi:hypothetical protein